MGWFEDNGYIAPDEQAPGPDWVLLDNGSWVPSDHPLAIEFAQNQQVNPGWQGPPPESFNATAAYGNDNPNTAYGTGASNYGVQMANQPAPGAVTTNYGEAPAGWDPNKWSNPAHNTPKYQIGRILQKYPSTPEGLRRALPEIQQLFPGASISGTNGDRLVIPGLDTFDVGRGFSSGGNQGWQWLPESEQGTGRTAPPAVPSAGTGTTYSGGFPATTGSTSGGVAPFVYSGGVSQYSNPYSYTAGGFIPPDSPSATSWSPQAMTTPSSVAPQTITAAGQAPTQYGSSPITATGSMGSLASPEQFSYGQALPSTFVGEPKLDSNKPVSPLGGIPDFSYNPLASSQKFELPTGQQALEQDPGYQFRLEQGRKALEQSAAGRGLLRTGGTLKDINAFGQQMGSQEYANAVSRARDTYALNQAVRQGEQAQQFGQGLSAAQQNEAQRLARFNAELAAAGQNFQQAATQQGMNAEQALRAYQANLTGQQQGYSQAASTAQMNAANALNAYAANAANYNAAAQRELAAQQANQANAFNYAGLNLQNYNLAAERQQQASMQNAANALAAQQFNVNTGLAANQQANAFGLQGAQFNAAQAQQAYQNAYNAANQAKAYQMQQQQIDLTADQQRFMQGLNSQQQAWMQEYMSRGQSFDQAYRNMIAELQYMT